MSHSADQDAALLRQNLGTFMPLGLLGAGLFTVFVSTGPALYFSPNEINFLFAGPFRRRDLVVYKLCAYVAGAAISAAIISLLIPPRASSGASAFVGLFLTLLFVQLGSAAVGLLSQAYAESPLVRARQPIILALFAVTSLALLTLTASSDRNMFDVLSAFRHSAVGGIVLAPFAVFSELLLARRVFPDLIQWTAVAVAINCCLLAVIIALDQRATDRALSENRRLNNRWQRIKNGASFWASDKTTGNSVKRAPELAGIGPVAWRQAINAVRNSGKVIVVFFAMALLTGPAIASAGFALSMGGIIGFGYVFIGFVLPRSLVCDFRGELARIELYKSLPIAPWRICAGQLVMPVLLASAIQLVMIFSTLPFLAETSTSTLFALAAFTVPVNLLLYGFENLVFLLFPSKLVPVGRVDFEFLGRALVDFMIKTILFFSAIAIAGSVGYFAASAFGKSLVYFSLAAWLTLGLIGLATVPLLGAALHRFRISETID